MTPTTQDDEGSGRDSLEAIVEQGDQELISVKVKDKMVGNSELSESLSAMIITDNTQTIKCGDNSVHLVDTSSDLLCDIKGVTLGATPNYNEKVSATFTSLANTIDVDVDEGIYIKSDVFRRRLAASFHTPVEVPALAMPKFLRTPAAARLHKPQVIFGESSVLGKIDEASISLYLFGGAPDIKKLSSSLSTFFAPTPAPIVQQLGSYIMSKHLICDNFAIYAKLAYYVLVLSAMAACDIVQVPSPFEPVVDRVQYLGTLAAGFTGAQIGAAIQGDGLVLLENLDYQAGDELILEWLCQPGNRIAAPTNHASVHLQHVIWPQIPTTVVRVAAAAPDIGLPRIPEIDDIIAFMVKMAAVRNEQEALNRGIYWAQAYCGLSFSEYAGNNRAPDWYPIWPDLGVGNLAISRPSNYNCLLRALKIFPTSDTTVERDTKGWTECSPVARLGISAVYTVMLSCFASTIMIDANLVPSFAQQYATQHIPQNTWTSTLEQVIFIRNKTTSLECPFYRMIWRAFKIYADINVPVGLNCRKDWSNRGQNSLDDARAYNDFAPNVCLIMYSPLAIHNWITTRPIEWAVPSNPTTVNFLEELERSGIVNRTGWCTAFGEAKYKEYATSSHPYKFIPYGALAANVLAQIYGNPQGAFQHMEAQIVEGAANLLWAGGAQPVPGANYDDVLRLFEVGSIRSFDHETNTMYAPAYRPQGANPIRWLQNVINMTDKPVENCGYGIGSQIGLTSNKRVASLSGFAAIDEDIGSTSNLPPNRLTNTTSGTPTEGVLDATDASGPH